MVFDNFENIAGSNEFLPIFIEAQEGIPLAVGDYFTGEILNGLEDHLKGFLMQLAFLPAATAAAAREMTEDPKAGNILESIYRRHLFVERFFSSTYTYQFYPMFRAFLLKEARDNLDPEEIQQAWRRAAGILESMGRVEDALECFAQLPDANEIARLIQTHAVELIQQGRLETLGAWLSKIPETMLAESPWLLFWTGMCFRPGEAEKARHWFEKAKYLKSMPPLAEVQARVAASMSGALIIRQSHHPSGPTNDAKDALPLY